MEATGLARSGRSPGARLRATCAPDRVRLADGDQGRRPSAGRRAFGHGDAGWLGRSASSSPRRTGLRGAFRSESGVGRRSAGTAGRRSRSTVPRIDPEQPRQARAPAWRTSASPVRPAGRRSRAWRLRRAASPGRRRAFPATAHRRSWAATEACGCGDPFSCGGGGDAAPLDEPGHHRRGTVDSPRPPLVQFGHGLEELTLVGRDRPVMLGDARHQGVGSPRNRGGAGSVFHEGGCHADLNGRRLTPRTTESIRRPGRPGPPTLSDTGRPVPTPRGCARAVAPAGG